MGFAVLSFADGTFPEYGMSLTPQAEVRACMGKQGHVASRELLAIILSSLPLANRQHILAETKSGERSGIYSRKRRTKELL